MRLRLNLSGIDMQLKIKDWSVQDIDIGWGEWCDIELLFSGNYFNYDAGGEILTNREIRELCIALGKFIDGEIKTEERLYFVEPDLGFILRPARRIECFPSKLSIATNDHTYMEDIKGELRVHVASLPYNYGNFVSMWLTRYEFHALYVYLLIVTGQIEEDSNEVTELVNNGVIQLDN